MNTKFLAVTALLIGLFAINLPALAQRGIGDSSGIARQAVVPKLETIRGVLKAIETGPCENTTGRATMGTHLIVTTSVAGTKDSEVNIHLGPSADVKSVVEQLSAGQPIVVEAFRTEKHAPGHFVAKRVKLDGKFVELRGDTLRPQWARGNEDRGRGRKGWSQRPRNGSVNDRTAKPTRRGRGFGGRGRGFSQTQAGTDSAVLSSEVRQSILHMREEEKLARDVYLTLSKKYATPVFSNIAGAESRHMAALERLLSRYGLPDPVVDDTIGRFANSEFAHLYDELVAKGSKSLADAYEVGALIEELDISDLNSGATLIVGYPDIQRVYQNLTRGSRNHLRAFAFQLDVQGKTYTAQHLSQEAFDKIASSPRERGGRRSR